MPPTTIYVDEARVARTAEPQVSVDWMNYGRQKGPPVRNPAFSLLECSVFPLAGRTLAEAHLEHAKESDHSIEGIVPLRESALNVLNEAIRKHDALGVSPAKE